MVRNDTLVLPASPPAAGLDTDPWRGPAGAVEPVLADFLAAEVAELYAIDAALGDLGRAASTAVLAGGKRLRPAFGYWGWRGALAAGAVGRAGGAGGAGGGFGASGALGAGGAGADPPVEDVLPALAALELLHAFALVHDDVMDGSASRRGRPTAHRVLAAEHRDAGRRGDPDRFGESGAVLVGDLCLIWADRLLARSRVPAATLLATRVEYDRMRLEAVAGQYLDVLGEAEPHRWSVTRAMRVAGLKTAAYTVRRPLRLGAALAGGCPPGLARRFDRYGAAVGEAFQLCDDLLGVYGDPAVTGKPAGDDLRTGKPTALLMLAGELATPAQRAALAAPAGGDLDPAGIDALREVITATGAPERVARMIDERVETAFEALADGPLDAATRAALAELATIATHRRA